MGQVIMWRHYLLRCRFLVAGELRSLLFYSKFGFSDGGRWVSSGAVPKTGKTVW